jgi:hypothetical protein
MKNNQKKEMTMKKTLLLCLVCGAVSLPAGDESSRENKLLGLWRFDEGAGEVIHDSSGNSRDGKILNNMRAVEWVEGRKGMALRFSGTRSGNKSGCVLIPDFSYDLSGGMTVEAWIKINKDASSEGLYEIITNAKANCGVGFRLYYNWRNFTFISGAGGDKAETWGAVYKSVNPRFGEWTHIAATYDGSVHKLYINGEEAAKSPEKQPFTNGNNFLCIGSAHQGVSYGFEGIIDDVKIYNYARPPAEIIQSAKLDM